MQCTAVDNNEQCLAPALPNMPHCEWHRQTAAAYGLREALPEPTASTIEEPIEYDQAKVKPVDCKAQTRLGYPCHAFARHGRPYCIAHDPEFRRQHILNAKHGGMASALARASATSLDADAIDLSDRTRVQVLIDAVIRLELTGHLKPERARTLTRLLNLAVNNFDTMNRPNYLAGKVSAHDPGYYADSRNAIDLELDYIAFALREADKNADIQNATAAAEKRRLILQTEKDLGRRPESSREALLNSLTNLAN